MKIHRSPNYGILVEFTGAEAAWLLEELDTVPRGSKFPKIRQMCEGLRQSLKLDRVMSVAPKTGRPKNLSLVSLPRKRPEIVPQVQAMKGRQDDDG